MLSGKESELFLPYSLCYSVNIIEKCFNIWFPLPSSVGTDGKAVFCKDICESSLTERCQRLIWFCFASVHLYYLFPTLEEGGLATYRTAIVQNQHLAMLAKVCSCNSHVCIWNPYTRLLVLELLLEGSVFFKYQSLQYFVHKVWDTRALFRVEVL